MPQQPEADRKALRLPPIQSVRSINDLRKILQPDVWGYVVELINRTRSYESGLHGAELLAVMLETFRASMEDKEREGYFKSIQHLKLSMLDKLDLWQEYLLHWHHLRVTTDFELCYAAPLRRLKGSLMPGDSLLEGHSSRPVNPDYMDELWAEREPFITRMDKQYVYLHWLYGLHHRRDVIARKAERRLNGKERKSDRHKSQLDLTEQELRYRLIEFERIIREVLSEREA